MSLTLLDTPGLLAAAAAIAGLAQAAAGLVAVWRFRRGTRPRTARRPAAPRPAITILKPLHGDEPMLEDALASFCAQRYPQFQIVFGLQDPADPALHVLRRLRARFPAVAMEVVIDSTPHGTNRKVANLINMLPVARHDTLLVSDSDIHAAPDYLDRVAQALAEPGTGLVTSLYAGLPASTAVAAQLGAAQINHSFLPGNLLARGLGRQACLGATMALRRETLAAIGGFEALVHELADDAVLGLRVNALGLQVRLAGTVPATTVPETALPDLLRHELRWARTIQSLVPVQYAMSSLQYPLFWALLAILLSGGTAWASALFGLTWIGRAAAAFGVERGLRLAPSGWFWFLPLRDLISIATILASYAGDSVHWRGQILSASRPRLVPGKG